jgi:hypothetical protein
MIVVGFIILTWLREKRMDKEMNRRHDILVEIVQENTSALTTTFSMLRVLANKVSGCPMRGQEDEDATKMLPPVRQHRTPRPDSLTG